MVSRSLIKNIAVALLWGAAAHGLLRAEGLPLDYCQGQIATRQQGNINGLSGNGATITLAVTFPAADLNVYAGSQVSSLRVGIPEATQYPESITLTLRNTRDGEALCTGTVTDVSAGWMETQLTTPYAVTGAEDLWVTASYTQATKLNILSFAGQTSANACFVSRNGAWTDFSTRNLGSLSLGMTIEGEQLTQHDLAVHAEAMSARLGRPGQPIHVEGTVSNLGAAIARDIVLTYSMTDPDAPEAPAIPLGSTLLTGEAAYTQDIPFALDITLPQQELEGELQIVATRFDGVADEHPADNVAVLPMAVMADAPFRRMVVEEGTGTWCGFCPRGIVGLKQMAEVYPERFIGIAVHYNDNHALSTYGEYVYLGCNRGLPGALINRDGSKHSPHPDSLIRYIDRMPIWSEADLRARLEITNQTMLMDADVTFLLDQEGRDYRLAFVTLEDSLVDIQTNYFSGGDEGPMGGFEDLPGKCPVQLMDVARGIYPSVEGASGIIPEAPRRGQTYSYHLEVALPTYIRNVSHVRLAVLLIDALTGEVMQGALTRQTSAQGITVIRPDHEANAGVYDLFGHRLRDGQQRGFRIGKSRKIYAGFL